jgi:hypothetical protein
MQGANSQVKKIDAMVDLYGRCVAPSGLEIKYLVRCLNPATGLRIGLSNKSMEKAFLEYVQAE